MVIAVVLVLLVLWWYHQQVVIYKFFRPDCPHCVNLQAAWEEFETYLSGTNIRVINVNNNSDYSKTLVTKHGINGVPTIFAVSKLGSKVEYTGDRTAASLISWAGTL